jgi:periplasmic protein TonB
MPREIFGDVTKPSIKIGSRKWYTVPVSMGTHGLIVLGLIVLPMLAPGLLPMPDATTVFTVAPPPPPLPPPPAVHVAETPPQQISNPNAAPTEAPDTIGREVDRPPYEPPVETNTATVVGVYDAHPPEAPPPVSAPPEPFRVGGQVRPPTKIRESPLVYPQMAQVARVQGMVIIEATIGTDGRVANAKVLRSVPLLDQAALDAVRTWEYTPTLLNGVPVAVIMTVVVQFNLN